jgi:hypothetical protein
LILLCKCSLGDRSHRNVYLLPPPWIGINPA